MLSVLVVALAAALLPGALRATNGPTLYVDGSNASCSNSGSGTATQPFCTVGAAASTAIAGQTVQVAAGTYPEHVAPANSGSVGAPIVFTTAPGATVTVTGAGVDGFTISTKSWITVNGFTVTGTSGRGFSVSNSSHITISNNHVSHAGQPTSGLTKAGIYLSNVTDSLVSGNTSDHNSDYGIVLTNGSTRDEIRGNATFNNARGYERAAAGIRLYTSPSNTVDGNVTHDNEDSGIECYTGSNNTFLYNNVAFNNGDHGIDNYQTTGERVIANTIYKNVTAGINIEGGSTGSTIRNNISVDNGIKSPRTHSDIRVESGSTSGTTVDSDLVYLTVPDTVLIWNSISYSSLAAFQAASGQEAHGIQADPNWKSPTTGDFHLTAGSLAIDSADSGASGQPSVDIDGNGRVDDPAMPNTGLGPSGYYDRGAYEFAPAVDAPPVAALSVSGTAPLSVGADASPSTDTDGTPIATYSFDFGDGSGMVGPQSEATATHTYAASGTYTVAVTVTDTAGLSSTTTASVQVAGDDTAPAVSLAVAPASGSAPLTVTADASASTDTDATPIASYRFDFGDGTSPVGPQTSGSAMHTYSTAGAYTVTATVTDTAGLFSTATATVQVAPAEIPPPDSAPTAALTVSPSAGTINLAVTADASASTDTDATPIASYSFDFGDGSTVVGPQAASTATHVYTVPGTYMVRLTVTDTAGLSSTVSATVTVTDARPVASLSLSPSSGSAPIAVTADASASSDTDATPIASYTFKFGDGSALVGPQSSSRATHTYTSGGTFTVTVTVRDTAGLTSTATKKIKLR